MAAADLKNATPDDNDELAPVLVGLTATHNASVIAGIAAPGWFGLAAEILAISTDVAVKHTAPSFIPPPAGTSQPFEVTPNASRSSGAAGICVYKFGHAFQPVIGDGNDFGITEQYASLFGINHDPLNNVWSDLGQPTLVHPQADVTVSVNHPFLAGPTDALRLRPEFPEGHHVLSWTAQTKFNPITDAAFPIALLPTFSAAESYLQKKLAVKGAARLSAKGLAPEVAEQIAKKTAARQAQYLFQVVGVLTDLGIVTADIANDGEAFQWYRDTSVVGATNSAQQSLTVWDVHPPYFANSANPGGGSIDEQILEIEAMDFGGVKFDRVAEMLQGRFEAIDPCGKQFNITTDTPRSTLLTIGSDANVVEWVADEIDGGPYVDSGGLPDHQQRIGEQIRSTLTQRITVVDTQAPILLPPAGFARYNETGIDLTSGSFPLGKPRVVDLADPSPTVTNNAPAFLPGPPVGADGIRHDIVWDAIDHSLNAVSATSRDPASLVQTITLKRPGTNTPPTALPISAFAQTGTVVDIVLDGTDVDVIDGRVDPLAFKIKTVPGNGQFEAPLYPYFIEDFRLTPAGQREEADNLTRTSSLAHLADRFRLALHQEARPSADGSPIRGTLLNQEICVNPTAQSQAEFGGVIPTNFVYRPKSVYIDDDGNYYILDSFFSCDQPWGFDQQLGGIDHSGELNALPRISKWDEDGALLDVMTLVPLSGFTSVDCFDHSGPFDTSSNTGIPLGGFSVDHSGRMWMTFRKNSPQIGFGSAFTHCSIPKELDSFSFHGASAQDGVTIITDNVTGPIAGDANAGVLFQTTPNGIIVRQDSGSANLASVDPSTMIGILDQTQITTSGALFTRVDTEGFVYALESSANRIHKYAPTLRTGDNSWTLGAYIGWMGSCTANKTNNGVPFNRCDESTATSRGFTCTDATCTRAADTSGSAPGQFNSPASIELDPRNILYVADTENFRVQRFGPDGVFAGQAISTGTGINQGDAPGFVLGNMGKPRQLSVNSGAFLVMEPDPADGDEFVHVFKTLPFREVTDSSASIRYVSDLFFQGNDAFSYTVDDGIDESEPAVVNLSVTRAFNPPDSLQAQCLSSKASGFEIRCVVDEDESIAIRLSSADVDGFLSDAPFGQDVHTFNIVDGPQHGTLVLDDPTLKLDNSTTLLYTPDRNFNGTDSFAFDVSDGNASSDRELRVELSVTPRPDPVAIELPGPILAARGFSRAMSAKYSDPDEDPDHEPVLVSLNWGDGAFAQEPDWMESGHFNESNQEISPDIKTTVNQGILFGSHRFDAPGIHNVEIFMSNPSASSRLPMTIQNTQVEVIEATVVGAALASPKIPIDPQTPFNLAIDVTNYAPDGWVGLMAGNVRATMEVPEGIQLIAIDPRCTRTRPVECTLGDLAPGEISTIAFTANVAVETARETADFVLMLEMFDDGPNIVSRNLNVVTVSISDADSDGVIDVDDAFPNDPNYSADTDGDGLADAWELEHGLDPLSADDTSVDTDGDGFSLLDEFTNQTFPNLAEIETSVRGENTIAADGSADDRFGFSVAGGDLNQDGYADTVLGAPLAGSTGKVYLRFGGEGEDLNSALQEISPSGSPSSFGRSLAVGDWDDNGFPDIAIGHNNGVRIHYNNGGFDDLHDLDLPGPTPSSNMGVALLNADLDADGLDDLIATAAAASGASVISLWLSTQGGLNAPPTLISEVSLPMGESVGVGDVDGDGFADLLVGSPAGATSDVVGYLGRDNDWSAPDLIAEPSFRLLTPVGTSQYGYRLVTGADVGDDGIDDLVVSDYSGAGSVFYYDSATNWVPELGQSVSVTPTQTISGRDDGTGPGNSRADQFGVALALGHLDSNTYADLVVGSNRAGPNDEGQVRVLRGSPAGFVERPEDNNGIPPFDMLGYSVSIPGDIDGDGYHDIVVGAPDIVPNGRAAPDGGYASLLYHRFVPRDPTEDLDSDGVAFAIDNCPTDSNTNQADLDRDGIGDACDSDIDGDGNSNEFDNCPLIRSDNQSDVDGDGLGDVCDDDDDADGVPDIEDAFPLDARYRDDSDGDGLPDLYEANHGLDALNADDAAEDLDGDGRNNLQEFLLGSDVAVDDVAPEMSVPEDIAVTSVGPYTRVRLVAPVVVDSKDGALLPISDVQSPFVPGRHTVTWSAMDEAGNGSTVSHRVDVVPLMNLNRYRTEVVEGQPAEFVLRLNGAAVVYPVTVPYAISGSAQPRVDHDGANGILEIAQGESVALTIGTVDDDVSDDGETLVLTLGEPTNAALGTIGESTVAIREGNLPPSVKIRVSQGGTPTFNVVKDGGPVSVLAIATDPNPSTVLSYDWSRTDPVLPRPMGSELSFDPSALSAGLYRAGVTISDDGEPTHAATARRYIKITENHPQLQPNEDSDGDGTDDVDEGRGDSNGNGVSNHLDPTDKATLLIARTGGLSFLQSLEGLQLQLGPVAIASGDDAELTMADILAYGNEGLPSPGADDIRFRYPGGIYDFEIGGVSDLLGGALVVVPQSDAIPADASYRKFVPSRGWSDFVVDEKNALSSATGEPGVCPAPGHTTYSAGLTAGHYCVQLMIEDGGPNDGDGAKDGAISDPGGVAMEAVAISVTTSSIALSKNHDVFRLQDIEVLRFSVDVNSPDVELAKIDLEPRVLGNQVLRVSNIEIWWDANTDGALDDGDVLVGTADIDSNDAPLQLRFNQPFMLPMGRTEFIVSYDFAVDFP